VEAQFWASSARSPSSMATVEHSIGLPAIAPPASSSVRALTANSASTGCPEPAAMPSISSASAGRKARTRASASRPPAATSSGPRPQSTSKSRR
jgi:hypothetical protein